MVYSDNDTSCSSSSDEEVRVTRSLNELDRFEMLMKKLNSISKGQRSMKKKLKKLDDIEEQLIGLRTDHDALVVRVTSEEKGLAELTAVVNDISIVKEKYENEIKKNQISQVGSKFSSMRFNIIIRNYPQDTTNAWESKEDSVKIVRTVLKDVLKVPRSDSIVIADAHRLSSNKGRRPLIFKLTSLVDKAKIWDCVANIKDYNALKTHSEKVKIDMVHLPEKLSQDKSDLWKDYWKAKDEGRRPKWWFDVKEGQYCFKVGDTVFRPAHDNFLLKPTTMVESAANAAN